uniref:Polymerase nucleotidyl transferase domain-containing protein n=1 Tax=Setaria digitata TaxID=48799 RepID=A0A915Q3F2_9BILA
MKASALKFPSVCSTTQPVRAKVRYSNAKSQQASSTTVVIKNNEKKFAVCDSFVEFMVNKHQEELQRLSALVRQEAIKRHSSYMQTLQYRTNIVTGLRRILANNHGQYLVPVGSTASGLASGTSDIDLVYVSTTDEKQREKLLRLLAKENFRRTFMTEVKTKIEESCLCKEFDWTQSDIIHTARVPILHLQTHKHMQVDIQFEKYASIRNTYFVRRCAQYDARVALLNLWAQNWLESQRLKDSKHGLFSTYHVLMLVLHFLQCTGSYGIQAVLPIMCKKFRGYLRPTLPIQRVAVSLYGKPKDLDFRERQEPDVAELILLFVSHYAKYDFNHISLHLSNATVTEKNQFGNEYEQHQLSIFDPYASATICRVKGGADLLTNAFLTTKKAMLAGHCLNWPVSMK